MGCGMEAPLMSEEEECVVRIDKYLLIVVRRLPPWDAAAVLRGYFFISLTLYAMQIRIAIRIYDIQYINFLSFALHNC